MDSGENSPEFAHEVRVSVNGFRKYNGYTDLVETYCCSATPTYYVVFPTAGYEGYFNKWNVRVKGQNGD